MSSLFKQKGFTLVELLVAVAISLALLGLTVVGYRRFLDQRTMGLVLTEVKSQLRLVRSKAMSGEKPSGCTNLNGYQVTLSGGNLAYSPICDGVVGAQEIITLTSADGPIGISLSSNFIFRSIDGSLDPQTAVVSLTYGALAGEVQIFTSGEIQETSLEAALVLS